MDDAKTIHSLVIRDFDTGERFSCSDHPGYLPTAAGLRFLESADVLIGHNILTYDLPTLRRLCPGFDPKGKVIDTLVCSRLIWTDLENEDFRRREKGVDFPPTLIGKHSLAAWGFRLGVLKGVFSETTDWQTWSVEMQTYCEQDVEVTAALFTVILKQNYSEQSVELEHDFRWVIHLQEKHGFRFNRELAIATHVELVARRTRLLSELRERFPSRWEEMKTPEHWAAIGPFGDTVVQCDTKGAVLKSLKGLGLRAKDHDIRPGPNKRREIPFNPASRDQVAERLRELGWEPLKLTDGGKPAVDDESLERCTLPCAKLLRDYFLVEKRIGQIAEGDKAWLKLERDGRLYGQVITNGAVTGRCTHFNPNIAQVPKVKTKDKHPIVGFDGGYGYECRSMYLADVGMVLVGWDASGLELRCLAHYMARYDGGEYGRLVLDGDVHTVNQKAAGLDTRDGAKTFIYSYLYGAGDELIGENAGGAKPEEIEQFKRTRRWLWGHYVKRLKRKNRVVTDQVVGNCVKGAVLREQFEQKTPALAQLKADIKAAIQARGYLVGLDGRRLHVRSEHSALNTLLQSAGAILVKMATVLLYKKLVALGWRHGIEWAQHAHVHDEVQASVKPELAEQYRRLAIESIREAGEAMKFRIRLDGDSKQGPHWAATH